jgi:hypothetical protein
MDTIKLNNDLDEGRAIVNAAAFRLIMRVVNEAVYGAPLDRESQVVKELYDFMESDKCRINLNLL